MNKGWHIAKNAENMQIISIANLKDRPIMDLRSSTKKSATVT